MLKLKWTGRFTVWYVSINNLDFSKNIKENLTMVHRNICFYSGHWLRCQEKWIMQKLKWTGRFTVWYVSINNLDFSKNIKDNLTMVHRNIWHVQRSDRVMSTKVVIWYYWPETVRETNWTILWLNRYCQSFPTTASNGIKDAYIKIMRNYWCHGETIYFPLPFLLSVSITNRN